MDEKQLRAVMLGVASTVLGALGDSLESAGHRSTREGAGAIELVGAALNTASRKVDRVIQEERR
jgi:hypothetical protein